MDMIAVILIIVSPGSSTLSGTQRNKITQSCLTLCNPMGCSPPGSSVYGDSPGKNTGVGCHALHQGIFPTQGLNPDLPYCRQIPYHLSHQRSPRILEWVAYPFSRGTSRSRNQTGVSYIANGFFASWTEYYTLEIKYIITYIKSLHKIVQKMLINFFVKWQLWLTNVSENLSFHNVQNVFSHLQK